VRFLRWLIHNYDGVVTLVVVALVLGLMRFNALGSTRQIDLAILIVLGLLTYTILRERRRAEVAGGESQGVRLLNSVEIRRELEEARRRTNQWMFRGGTGTYLRAVTLPQCVGAADRERRHLRIQAEIIDPTNDVLCRRYASYRHTTPDSTGERWTPDRARNESYATILAACWYRQRYTTVVQIEVALSATVSTFRWDVSSSCAFMTQEDPSPHLTFTEPSPHYNFCTRHVASSFVQATRVPLERAKQVHLSDEPTVQETRCVFEALDIQLPKSVTDEDVAQIVVKALHARNPYP
jgi:hypothetical protein